MRIEAIKTKKISADSTKIFDFLDENIKVFEPRSIIVFSSKVLAILSGNTSDFRVNYEDIIVNEADYYTNEKNKYGHFLTIKNNAFISGSGIDQSNGNGRLVLLPKEPQILAKTIYNHLRKNYNHPEFGVVITDSQSTPLRRGAVGVSIGFYGFSPLHDYVGEKDLFGRAFCFEKANLVDQIASAANLVMGEGDEQTPIAIVNELKNIEFGDNLPTKEQLKFFLLNPDEDLYHILYEGRFNK
ncbi:MAG: coenzyme F420-0:L-glutamate ligase [bacterium]